MLKIAIVEDEKIYRAIAAGANGYILKRTKPNKLIQAIKDLEEGDVPITGSIAKKILNGFRQLMPEIKLESPLSEREQEVLGLIAAGYLNKEVADKMNVSVSTIKSHIYSIYQKLHVNSRVMAINKFKNQPKG